MVTINPFMSSLYIVVYFYKMHQPLSAKSLFLTSMHTTSLQLQTMSKCRLCSECMEVLSFLACAINRAIHGLVKKVRETWVHRSCNHSVIKREVSDISAIAGGHFSLPISSKSYDYSPEPVPQPQAITQELRRTIMNPNKNLPYREPATAKKTNQVSDVQLHTCTIPATNLVRRCKTWASQTH